MFTNTALQQVIGVAQLVNSTYGEFSRRDEKLFEAFGIYCGLSITAAKLYEETSMANAKHCVALDVLSYHATATDEETTTLSQLKVPTAASLRINTMEFDIRKQFTPPCAAFR
jgi:dual 3',5'-cyclic-AMP and -GMP phosphodiesterase 11